MSWGVVVLCNLVSCALLWALWRWALRAPRAVGMRLSCPRCSARHVDFAPWDRILHRTHRCLGCSAEWRPYDFPTVGLPPTDAELRDQEARDALRPRRAGADETPAPDSSAASRGGPRGGPGGGAGEAPAAPPPRFALGGDPLLSDCPAEREATRRWMYARLSDMRRSQ